MSAKDLLGCLIALATACAGNPSPAAGPADGGVAAQSAARSRDVIREDELQPPLIAASDVLATIKALRPQFLTVHSVTTAHIPGTGDDETGKVHASLDGTTIVSVDQLATVRTNTVKEIRYFTAAAAQEKFGLASRQGPVVLVTKK